jgi:hypothetical protein
LHGAADLELEVRKPTSGQPNQWVVKKFKAGPEGVTHSFRLEPLIVGHDVENEPITSCVIAGRMASDAEKLSREKPKGEVEARAHEVEFLRALSTAIERQGVTPPASVGAPRNVELVVESRYVRELYMEGVHLSESGAAAEAVRARFRQSWRRATNGMRKYNVIASATIDNGEQEPTTYIWFTGRPVSGNVTIRGVRVTEGDALVTPYAGNASHSDQVHVTPGYDPGPAAADEGFPL